MRDNFWSHISLITINGNIQNYMHYTVRIRAKVIFFILIQWVKRRIFLYTAIKEAAFPVVDF